ncbi:MAG: tyrosine-type recombinase/integrase [Alphaproteobacteria bacterium]|nr:tyrosine-type recombinase/integrase [Alphaproteobacteria bacterium]
MARIAVRYFVERPGRGGGVRRFWQPNGALRAAGWRSTRLADDRAAAIAQAETINAAVDRWRRGQPADPPQEHRALVARILPPGLDGGCIPPPRPGSLKALIHSYRLADDFRELRASTRRAYEDNLRTLDRWAGDAPLEVLTPERFVALWKSMRAETPTKAKGVVTMARILFGWARRSGLYAGYRQGGALVPENPATRLNIRGPKPRRCEADLWTPEEIAIFAAVAEHLGRLSIGVSVELNAWIGQREGDLLALTVGHYRNGEIVLRQSKTGARLSLPVDLVPELGGRLAALDTLRQKSRVAPTSLIFNERTGRPWTTHSFRHAFDDIRAEAARWCPSLAARQFMLLRHTAIVRLAEAGSTAEEISAISGHTLQSVNQVLERYLVRTKRMAAAALRKRIAAEIPSPD